MYEGNVSIRRDGLIYVTPTGKNKAFLSEDMIAVFAEGSLQQVGGKFPASSEFPLHTNAYLTRPDIGGVVHCHATFATAYSLCNKPIESRAYPELMGNFKRIEVAAYGTPGTDAIFTGVRPLLLQNDIVLMNNHGLIAVGRTLHEAMNRAEAVEAIARVLYYAERIGKPVDLPDTECQMFFAK